jgi:sugar phosphate isomerase/epimerase
MGQRRRDFIIGSGGALLWAFLPKVPGKKGFLWRLGLQSYSLREMRFEKAVETIKGLGLEFVEAFPGHLPMDRASMDSAKKILKEQGVKLISYGVVHISKDEKEARRLFSFAKEMGIEVLTADPDPDSFDMLDRLVEEFGIYVAVHNHGPGSRYPGAESVAKAIDGHHKKIGLCYDVGHGARAGEDIVAAVRTVKGRIYGVHMKDVDERRRDCVVGTGILDIKGFMKELKKAKFSGAFMLEYEVGGGDPIPGIRKSIEFLRDISGRI